ncbi:MAG: EAL domain-containing protein [Proteobacteria bacterium]|nr:EAL domain-containing protein [Pseudomonadota bacterium]
MKIKQKLLFVILLILLAPAIYHVYHGYSEHVRLSGKNLLETGHQELNRVRALIETEIRQSRTLLAMLAGQEQTTEYFEAAQQVSTSGLQESELSIEQMELVIPDGELIFVNRSGEILAKTNSGDYAHQEPDLQDLVAHMQTGNFIAQFTEYDLNTLRAMYAHAVLGADRRVLGHIVLVKHFDVLLSQLNYPVSLLNPLYLIYDEERQLLQSSHTQLVPWRISPAEIESLVQAAPKNELGYTFIEKTRYRGIAEKIYPGLILVYLVPEPEIEKANNGYLLETIIYHTMGIVLIFLLIMVALQKVLVAPMIKLINSASNLQNGDLKAVIPAFDRNDEIGSLAHSLEIIRRNFIHSQSESHRLVNQDALTGLPNRRSIMDRLDIEIQRCKRNPEESFALLFIDLDNFKYINDSMGHKAGDRLVTKVAQRLVESVRAYDSVAINRPSEEKNDNNNFVARLGGDEFLMIVNDIRDPLAVANIVERIYGLFKEPLYLDELHFHVGMSVGIVVYPGNGDTPEQLIKNADVAMYSAKSAGKNQFRFYDVSMDNDTRSSLEIESALRKALSEDTLELHFQPQISLTDGSLTGCEVLLRWFHPDKGWISPAEFIPVAESCGLIHEIGDWVLDKSLKTLKKWKQEYAIQPFLSINLSSYQIATEGYAQKVIELIKSHQLKPELIEFELTETAILKNKHVTVKNINLLRKSGIKIALDDFGTGYSSLAWLHYCDVDCIKIDRSFVKDITEKKSHKAIIVSVLELCKHLNLSSVAEGIELETEAQVLRTMGCENAQGYYYSRPIEEEKFVNQYLLNEDKARLARKAS